MAETLSVAVTLTSIFPMMNGDLSAKISLFMKYSAFIGLMLSIVGFVVSGTRQMTTACSITV